MRAVPLAHMASRTLPDASSTPSSLLYRGDLVEQ